MPHLTIQATPNVVIPHEESLLKAMNLALWNSGHFKQPTDIKARFLPVTTFLVGVDDDQQAFGFIYAHLKLMAGRDEVIKNALAKTLARAIDDELCAAQSARTNLQICVEVEELSCIYHKRHISGCDITPTDLLD